MNYINTLNLSVMQFHTVLIVLMVILHILVAAGIAKDIGSLRKRQLLPLFMPASAWVLAGLLSGIWGLLVYWLIHHSSISR